MGSEKCKNRELQGVGASPGIAIGRVKVTDRSRVAVFERNLPPSEVESEVERFSHALEEVKEDLGALKEQLMEQRGPEHLYIIDTHQLMLDDSMFRLETIKLIRSEAINSEWALKKTIQKFREFFSAIEDDYLRERVGDVEVVGEKVLRKLTGKTLEPINTAHEKVLIVAHDLSPADILQIDKSKVVGFAVDLGGKTSHSAILARALEIPAVVGLERATQELTDGENIIIDGAAGVVIVNPDKETFRNYLKKKQHYEYIEQELAKLRDLPAVTPDGHRISLKANVEFKEEVPSLKGYGAEGIGLYRTEMLFMGRDELPGEEEQFKAYSAIVKEMAPKPVTIRTLDVGGDKFVEGLNLSDEMNPALGLRAIRLSLREPATFKPQLRAILRASAFGKVRIFYPMISGVGEVRQAKKLLEEAKEELRAEGIAFDEKIEVGIMIEIPSAVIIADLLAREVDFFSVGTNDLIQYSLAIDRTNEHLADLYEPLHPAIIRSLKQVVEAAHAAGIDACMCGEMAGEPEYLPILLGLGFDELSMNSVSIPRVKQILRRCSKAAAERLVAQVLTFSTAAEIEALLKNEITAHYAASFD